MNLSLCAFKFELKIDQCCYLYFILVDSIILTLIIFHLNYLVWLSTLPNTTDPITGLTSENIFKILKKGLYSNCDTRSQPLYLTNWLIYTTEESCVNRWELQGFMFHNKRRRIVRFCAKQAAFSVPPVCPWPSQGATTTNHLEKGN